MHSKISEHNEGAAEHGESNAIRPQSLRVEAEGAKDGRTRDLDIETVFVVDEGKVFDFVDDEAFEGVVKYGQLWLC
jgi:hypothetical protein